MRGKWATILRSNNDDDDDVLRLYQSPDNLDSRFKTVFPILLMYVDGSFKYL